MNLRPLGPQPSALPSYAILRKCITEASKRNLKSEAQTKTNGKHHNVFLNKIYYNTKSRNENGKNFIPQKLENEPKICRMFAKFCIFFVNSDN